MSQTTSRSNTRVQDTPPQELRQLNISEGFNASTKQHLDNVWATAFYEANIPFNVVRHPAFVNAVRETVRHWMPAYKPPSYNAIRTTLLAVKKKNLDKQVKEKLGNSIDKYGVTLFAVMDGTMFKIGPSSTWFNVAPKGTFSWILLTPMTTTRTTLMLLCKFYPLCKRMEQIMSFKSAQTMLQLCP